MFKHDEDDCYAVFDALVEETGFDSFAERDLEVYYGFDYEHHVHDGLVNILSDKTGLAVWYVRNILLDDIPEVRAIGGMWHRYMNGMWKEFADV